MQNSISPRTLPVMQQKERAYSFPPTQFHAQTICMLCWMITWNMTETVDTPVNVTLVVMTSWICGVPNWQCCSETTKYSAFFPEFNYSKNSYVNTVINENLTKYTKCDLYIHISIKNLYNSGITFSIHKCTDNIHTCKV